LFLGEGEKGKVGIDKAVAIKKPKPKPDLLIVAFYKAFGQGFLFSGG